MAELINRLDSMIADMIVEHDAAENATGEEIEKRAEAEGISHFHAWTIRGIECASSRNVVAALKRHRKALVEALEQAAAQMNRQNDPNAFQICVIKF